MGFHPRAAAIGEPVPTLPDVLAKLSFLTTTPAIVGLVITASLIVVIRDWRFSLAALLGQYVLVGLLLTRLIQPQVALTKVLIGDLVCVVLYLTARLVSESSEAPPLEREDAKDGRSRRPASPTLRLRSGQASNLQPPTSNFQLPTSKTRRGASRPDFAFRLLATLFVGLAVYSLSERYPLPEVPSDIGFACYWLASMGLLVLVLTEEPLKAGMGLLTLITGFELFYSVLERSLSVVGFLGIANFLIALAIAYLTPSTSTVLSLPKGSGHRAASGTELTPEERQR